jgi:hypothetical protein
MQEARPTVKTNGNRQNLGSALIAALAQGHGMNDFLFRFLHAIGSAVRVARLALYDYDEALDSFDIIYFSGYPETSRFELHMRLHELDVRRALKDRSPYMAGERVLLVPLYFQETLEAVLMLEAADALLDRNAASPEEFALISRFLGLFMSSSRLPVNQRASLVSSTDLQRAREIQLTYLPGEHPATERYEIFGYNQSSALVGGDYFDYFRNRERSIQCIVADACGHGLSAALIMSTFRGLLHAEVRRFDDLPGLFTRLNEQLYLGGELLQYLTAVFLDYEEHSGLLRYFNAGHFDPIIVHLDGSTSELKGGGPPLGMFRSSQYCTRSAAMKPDDLLILFTDGLVELRNPREDFFGVDGILDSVRSGRALPLRELARDVLTSASRFTGQSQPQDDLTLFLMRFR